MVLHVTKKRHQISIRLCLMQLCSSARCRRIAKLWRLRKLKKRIIGPIEAFLVVPFLNQFHCIFRQLQLHQTHPQMIHSSIFSLFSWMFFFSFLSSQFYSSLNFHLFLFNEKSYPRVFSEKKFYYLDRVIYETKNYFAILCKKDHR